MIPIATLPDILFITFGHIGFLIPYLGHIEFFHKVQNKTNTNAVHL